MQKSGQAAISGMNIAINYLYKLIAMAVLLTSATSITPGALAETTIRGTSEPSAQFSDVPHKNLRFLTDLMPGYVMAQRISDNAEVIAEIKDRKIAKLWEIDKAASAANRGMMSGWRRFWIADTTTKIIDPRDFLLIATEKVHRGLTNANGRVILDPIYHSIDIGTDFHIVALKLDDMQTIGELQFFDSAGKLIATKSDISPATGGYIDNGMVLIQSIVERDKAVKKGLMNTDGVLIYPMQLETCMITAGCAHACEIVDGKCFYLAISRDGKILSRSLDENEVYKAEKPAQEAEMAARQKRLPPPQRCVNVANVQSVSQADHSLDTEHFSPAIWALPPRLNAGPRTAAFAGFLQDHNIIGMGRDKLEKLVGKGTENVFKLPTTLSYSIISHCEGSQVFTFKLENDRVVGWCYSQWGLSPSPPIPDWKITEPDLAAYPWRWPEPIPDNE